MQLLSEQPTNCPYCGELVSILVDGSQPQQDYFEDCEVCCRPMRLAVSIADDGSVVIINRREDE